MDQQSDQIDKDDGLVVLHSFDALPGESSLDVDLQDGGGSQELPSTQVPNIKFSVTQLQHGQDSELPSLDPIDSTVSEIDDAWECNAKDYLGQDSTSSLTSTDVQPHTMATPEVGVMQQSISRTSVMDGLQTIITIPSPDL